jgi:Uma2 family endonuclease
MAVMASAFRKQNPKKSERKVNKWYRQFYASVPKLPTVSVYTLNQSRTYQLEQFRGDQLVRSQIFPELKLSANQILNLGI